MLKFKPVLKEENPELHTQLGLENDMKTAELAGQVTMVQLLEYD